MPPSSARAVCCRRARGATAQPSEVRCEAACGAGAAAHAADGGGELRRRHAAALRLPRGRRRALAGAAGLPVCGLLLCGASISSWTASLPERMRDHHLVMEQMVANCDAADGLPALGAAGRRALDDGLTSSIFARSARCGMKPAPRVVVDGDVGELPAGAVDRVAPIAGHAVAQRARCGRLLGVVCCRSPGATSTCVASRSGAPDRAHRRARRGRAPGRPRRPDRRHEPARHHRCGEERDRHAPHRRAFACAVRHRLFERQRRARPPGRRRGAAPPFLRRRQPDPHHRPARPLRRRGVPAASCRPTGSGPMPRWRASSEPRCAWPGSIVNARPASGVGRASASPVLDDTLEALLGRADTALYAAKHAGRNCVRAA